jgi:hypothetical protein
LQPEQFVPLTEGSLLFAVVILISGIAANERALEHATMTNADLRVMFFIIPPFDIGITLSILLI